MAAQTPYQVTIPDAGVAADFTNEERGLAVANPQSSTAAGVYYMSRLINLKGGNYTLKIVPPNLGANATVTLPAATSQLLASRWTTAVARPAAPRVTVVHESPSSLLLNITAAVLSSPPCAASHTPPP